MKFSKKTILPSLAVALTVILILVKNNFFITYYPNNRSDYEMLETKSESVMDSINEKLIIEEQRLTGLKHDRDFQISGFKGIVSSWFCRGFGIARFVDEKYQNIDQSFLQLGSVGLNLNPYVGSKDYLQYYYKNNQGYISKGLIKEVNSKSAIWYNKDEKVDFRYSAFDKAIIIPISSPFWINITHILMWSFIIFYGAGFLFIVFNFVALLIDISRNLAFDPVNIKRLKSMVVYGLIISLAPCLIRYITYVVYKISYANKYAVFVSDFWDKDLNMLIFTIILYLIYIAFNSGYRIKQENDLTI